MKLILLTTIITLLTINSYGQESKTIYFDAKNNQVAENADYQYKRIITKVSPASVDIKEYYSNGKLKLSCQSISKKKYDLSSFDVVYLDDSKKIKLDGEYISYYPTGAKKHESFYNKGKLKKSVNYMENGDTVYFIVDSMPQFPGGEEKLRQYVASEVKYPLEAKEAGIRGMVFISFIVNKQGNVENVTVARGVHPLLDKEALRVVKAIPRWIPGTNNGKPENVSYTIPINFKLT